MINFEIHAKLKAQLNPHVYLIKKTLVFMSLISNPIGVFALSDYFTPSSQ